jgi:hypothetical protein
MIVYAVYIIKKDGITLLSEHFQSEDELPNDLLLGGLLGAIQIFTKETLGEEMKTIQVEGLAYHIRSFGFYTIALVTDLNKEPDSLIQELGLRFMGMYGEEMLDNSSRVDKFFPFKEIIKEIIGKTFDEDGLIKPSKMLSTKEIFELPTELKPIAFAMITLGEGTISEIAQECNLELTEVKKSVTKLQNDGYLGKKKKDNQEVFFCST